MPRSLATAAIIGLTLVVAPGAAIAADPMPTPDCHGQQIRDKQGDSADTQTASSGVPSSDLTGGWVTYDPATGKAQANIQVDTLTLGEMDAQYDGISWEMSFKGKKSFFVRAFTDITGATAYSWGEPRAVTDDQTAARLGGTTTGKMFEGKGGVIQIDIPLKEMGITAGESLKTLALEVRQWVTKPSAVPVPSQVPLYSYAPIYDNAAGGPVVLGPCDVGATPAAPVLDTTPTAGPAKLALKITVPKVMAKKAKKGAKLAFRLKGTASGLVVALKAGANPMKGAVVASGKLTSVKGSGTLTLKLKRALKKGVYTLYLTGRNADGKAAEGAVTVRVK